MATEQTIFNYDTTSNLMPDDFIEVNGQNYLRVNLYKYGTFDKYLYCTFQDKWCERWGEYTPLNECMMNCNVDNREFYFNLTWNDEFESYLNKLKNSPSISENAVGLEFEICFNNSDEWYYLTDIKNYNDLPNKRFNLFDYINNIDECANGLIIQLRIHGMKFWEYQNDSTLVKQKCPMEIREVNWSGTGIEEMPEGFGSGTIRITDTSGRVYERSFENEYFYIGPYALVGPGGTGNCCVKIGGETIYYYFTQGVYDMKPVASSYINVRYLEPTDNWLQKSYD